MDFEKLQNALDPNTKLVIGPINETMPKFLEQDLKLSPIGFISIDVDYYSSSVESLKVLEKESTAYLPRVTIYLDGIKDDSHNS